jgi:hypothetical protein
MTLAEGAWLSSTIRSFSTVVHRRRRSGPDKTETLLTFAHLLANQSANYRRQGWRPEGGPHRRVTHQTNAIDLDIGRPGGIVQIEERHRLGSRGGDRACAKTMQYTPIK